MPGYVHRGIHVVLPRELRSHCLPRIGTIACHQRATTLTSVLDLAAHVPLQAPGGSFLCTVTEPFPFLQPWHCVDVSLLPPCSCRRESLPRRRLAHRARSRAFGILSTNARCEKKMKDKLDDEIKLAGLEALALEELEKHLILNSNRLRIFEDARLECRDVRGGEFWFENS